MTQHAVQGVNGDMHLGYPTLACARAQPVADHLLMVASARARMV